MTLTGCAASSSSPQDRQDAAVKDPMKYKPSFDDDAHTTGSYDRNGMKRDLNNVINP